MLGFVVAGVLDAVINKDAIARYLGDNLILSNLLGAIIGIVTPLCWCSAIPTAITLYGAGSRRGQPSRAAGGADARGDLFRR